MDKNKRDLVLELFGELDEEGCARLNETLEQSTELRNEQTQSRRLLDRYREENLEEPPSVDYSSFPALKVETGLKRPVAWFRLAASVLLVVGAFVIGRVTSRPAVQPPSSDPDVLALARETEPSRPDMDGPGAWRQSVGSRISWLDNAVRRWPLTPPEVERVRSALRQDPSVNVRLAAVDALFSAPRLAPSSTDIGQILAREPSEPLRRSRVDWLAAARPAGWEETLLSVEQGTVSPLVRSRVRRYVGSSS